MVAATLSLSSGKEYCKILIMVEWYNNFYLPCMVVGTVTGDIKQISGCPNKLGKYCKEKRRSSL